MLPKMKEDCGWLGKIFHSVPFILKYCEEERFTKGNEDYKGYTWIAKGNKIRLIHPVTWLLIPFLILFVLFAILMEGLNEFPYMWKEIKDSFTII